MQSVLSLFERTETAWLSMAITFVKQYGPETVRLKGHCSKFGYKICLASLQSNYNQHAILSTRHKCWDWWIQLSQPRLKWLCLFFKNGNALYIKRAKDNIKKILNPFYYEQPQSQRQKWTILINLINVWHLTEPWTTFDFTAIIVLMAKDTAETDKMTNANV